ncbi:MAG: coproporphyrinogen III oxidase, partial [Alphaproteobacteria bacterium]
MKPLALYIHWPFCLSKCPYCDFNSHVASSIDQDVWQKAYAKELAHYAQLLPNRLIT